MIRAALRRLVDRVRARIAVEDPEDRIEGSGDVYRDPAYNGRYTAERQLDALADADDPGDGDGVARSP